MKAVFARVALRYLAATLIAKGLITADFGQTLLTNPDFTNLVEVGIGLAVGGATETWMVLAEKTKKKIDGRP